MKRFAAGVAVGLTFGMAVAAAGQGYGRYYETVVSIPKADHEYQLGYLAGVYDTVQDYAKFLANGQSINGNSFIRMVNCLNGVSQPNLGTFNNWALRIYPKYQDNVVAAAAILSECR
jgi:hypothetical protein